MFQDCVFPDQKDIDQKNPAKWQSISYKNAKTKSSLDCLQIEDDLNLAVSILWGVIIDSAWTCQCYKWMLENKINTQWS
jgi:hypothetical protein